MPTTHSSGAEVGWLCLEDQWLECVCSGELFAQQASSALWEKSHIVVQPPRLPGSLTGKCDDECVFIEKCPDAESHAVVAPPLVLASVTSLNSNSNVRGSRVKVGKSWSQPFFRQLLLWLGHAGCLEVCWELPCCQVKRCVCLCLYGSLWRFLCIYLSGRDGRVSQQDLVPVWNLWRACTLSKCVKQNTRYTPSIRHQLTHRGKISSYTQIHTHTRLTDLHSACSGRRV